jgi:hypothetical protein
MNSPRTTSPRTSATSKCATPRNCTSTPASPWTEVVESVNRGLARAQKEHNLRRRQQEGDIPFHYGIITCAMRFFNRHMSAYYAQLFDVMPHAPAKEVMAVASLEMARAAAVLAHQKGIPVVGFDIAGAEAGFPAIDHKDAYQHAHVHFLKKTVHAGEAYGPESIFQAITECHADRLGHGTFLFAADKVKDPSIKDPDYYVKCLVDYIASRRITLEVCPTSNLQTIPPSPPWPTIRCARCSTPTSPSPFARTTGWSPAPPSPTSSNSSATDCRHHARPAPQHHPGRLQGLLLRPVQREARSGPPSHQPLRSARKAISGHRREPSSHAAFAAGLLRGRAGPACWLGRHGMPLHALGSACRAALRIGAVADAPLDLPAERTLDRAWRPIWAAPWRNASD